jgi:hypothetical protein
MFNQTMLRMLISDSGLTSYASILSIYKETGWKKLSVRREKRKLSLFYDIVSDQSPGESARVQLSQTSPAYSKSGRIKIKYNVSMKFRDTLNLSFPRTATCLNVFAIIVFMWFDHLQSLFFVPIVTFSFYV